VRTVTSLVVESVIYRRLDGPEEESRCQGGTTGVNIDTAGCNNDNGPERGQSVRNVMAGGPTKKLPGQTYQHQGKTGTCSDDIDPIGPGRHTAYVKGVNINISDLIRKHELGSPTKSRRHNRVSTTKRLHPDRMRLIRTTGQAAGGYTIHG
jgi:hypothetical protein